MPTNLHTLAQRYFAYLDNRDLDGLLTLYAPGARVHGLGPQPLDAAGVKQAMTGFFDAFPDSRMPAKTVVAEADRVTIYHHFQGTHRGEFQGVPPTGKRVDIPALVTLHVNETGLVDEVWLNAEMVGLLMQIGAIPTPA